MWKFLSNLLLGSVTNIVIFLTYYWILGIFIKNRKSKKVLFTISAIIIIMAEFSISELNKATVIINAVFLAIGLFFTSGSK